MERTIKYLLLISTEIFNIENGIGKINLWKYYKHLNELLLLIITQQSRKRLNFRTCQLA
jgi:hypothetical protein